MNTVPLLVDASDLVTTLRELEGLLVSIDWPPELSDRLTDLLAKGLVRLETDQSTDNLLVRSKPPKALLELAAEVRALEPLEMAP